MKSHRWLQVLILSASLVALVACGAQHNTESTMYGWAEALNLHLGTGGLGGNYSYPEKLSEINPALSSHLPTVDGWGNEFFYYQHRDTIYYLISAGPDGQFGNADDIVLENAKQRKAEPFYANHKVPGIDAAGIRSASEEPDQDQDQPKKKRRKKRRRKPSP